MSRRFILGFAGIAALLILAGNTHASVMAPAPMTFSEVFLGGSSDIEYMNMVESDLIGTGYYVSDVGDRAKFMFDLGGIGGEGRLLNTSGIGDRRVDVVDPTTDETLYDPTLFDRPYMAYVDFYFSDFFFDVPADSPEQVRIRLGSDAFSVTMSFTLEDVQGGQQHIRIDLVDFGLLDALLDGQLLATVIATPFGVENNTFVLDQVALTAEAMPLTAVPIPSAVFLLGAGLFGLIGFRAKQRKS